MQLMLGDIVISVETAARQAEERGHTLIDEIRILMVGFTTPLSPYLSVFRLLSLSLCLPFVVST